MDIFGIDPENLNKIDIHNFEKKSKKQKSQKRRFFVKNAGRSCLSANISNN